MQPRRAHANERFIIEMHFESPLPDGAVPYAELAGPIGPGGPALTFWTSAAGPVRDDERSHLRLTGKVPQEAPPGRYRVTHVEVRWTGDMPLSWVPAPVALDGLPADIVIEVETSTGSTQPPIPRLVDAG